MSDSLNTAQALLTAENFDGARRIARDALENDSQNIKAWIILVNIEQAQKNNKKALEITSQALALLPDHMGLRQLELQIFINMGKKRRARLGILRFKEDFPFTTNAQTLLDIEYEYQLGDKNIAKSAIEEASLNIDSATAGSLQTNTGALLAGQRSLQNALKADPNSYRINASLAVNQQLLAKPTSARKAARRALAAKPSDTNMRLLSGLTWFLYYPPVYYLHVLCILVLLAHRRVPTIVLVLIILPLLPYIFYPLNRFEKIIETMGFPYFSWVSSAAILGYFLAFSLFNSKLLDRLFSSFRKVQLKGY